MKECPVCAKPYGFFDRLFQPTSCSGCWKSEESKKSSAKRENTSSDSRSHHTELTFDCINCGVIINLRTPPIAEKFQCGKCRHAYKWKSIGLNLNSIVIIPDAIVQAEEAKPERPIYSKEVLAASGTATTDQIQSRRQEHLDSQAQCYPEKVCELGEELDNAINPKTQGLMPTSRAIRTTKKNSYALRAFFIVIALMIINPANCSGGREFGIDEYFVRVIISSTILGFLVSSVVWIIQWLREK